MKFSCKKKSLKKKNEQLFLKWGEKTPKNPRISWVFPKSGTGGELIYSDFANRSSIQFSCQNKFCKKICNYAEN